MKVGEKEREKEWAKEEIGKVVSAVAAISHQNVSIPFQSFLHHTLHLHYISNIVSHLNTKNFDIIGFIGCCLPPLGNYFIAERTGDDDVIKYIGFLDFFGGGGIFSAAAQMIMRGKIREREGIEGSVVGDCLTTFCCLSCSTCQMSNHLGLD